MRLRTGNHREERDDRRHRHQRTRRAEDRRRRPFGPDGRRHRQGDVGARQDRRGRSLLREALHAVAASALVNGGLRLHRGQKAVGGPEHVHRRREEVPRVRLLRVLPRRGASDAGAPTVCDGGSDARGQGLPHHPDLGRGQAHRLLERLLPRGLRHPGRQPWRDDRQAALCGQRRLGEALQRDPPRVRLGPAQGPERLPVSRSRRDRLHDRYRGHARPHRRPLHDQVDEGARLVPGLHGRVHRRQPRRVATRRLRGQVPRRCDQGRSGEREDRRGHAEGVPAGGHARLRPAVGGRPIELRDALLPLVRDLRIRGEVALEEARGDGPRSGHARCGMTQATAQVKRGRPSTGARERILDAAIEVLKADGYAGLTFAKVAAGAGESKALVAYHYGSKQGLVQATGRAIAEMITEEVLATVDGATTVESVVRGAIAGVENVLDEGEGAPRLYFDLAAVAVVDPAIRGTITEVNENWRVVPTRLLTEASDGLPPARARVLTVMLVAGMQGMTLERIERGQTPERKRALELFIQSALAATSHTRA